MVEQVREQKVALAPDMARAIRDAFGSAPIEEISALGGGASGARVLSLTIAGARYVLKKNDPERLAHELRARRELVCLRIASERGVAPRLRHVDEAAGIAIMERIEGAQLGRGGSRRIERVARTVRHLHEGPAFPPAAGPAGVARQWDEAQRARGKAGLPAVILGTLGEIERVTGRFAGTAPCHNDLNPGNMLETEEAIYLVDWDTAAQGDPFFDLGQLGVFAFPAPAQREELLEAYLGRRPSDEERARATLARAMALGFYAAGFLLVSAMSEGAKPEADGAMALPWPAVLCALGEGRARPEVVAVSLLAEMRREMDREEWQRAKSAFAVS